MQGVLAPDSLARVEKAVELYKKGVAPKIIMSGAYSTHLEKAPPSTEAQAMKDYAEQLGVDSKDVMAENESTHTIGNAYFTKKRFCEPQNWHSIVVVASGEHLPRVQYLFGKLFGTLYHFEFVESKRVLNDKEYAKELAHEQDSMARTQKNLDSVDNGDDSAVRAIFVANLPDDPIAKYQ